MIADCETCGEPFVPEHHDADLLDGLWRGQHEPDCRRCADKAVSVEADVDAALAGAS